MKSTKNQKRIHRKTFKKNKTRNQKRIQRKTLKKQRKIVRKNRIYKKKGGGIRAFGSSIKSGLGKGVSSLGKGILSLGKSIGVKGAAITGAKAASFAGLGAVGVGAAGLGTSGYYGHKQYRKHFLKPSRMLGKDLRYLRDPGFVKSTGFLDTKKNPKLKKKDLKLIHYMVPDSKESNEERFKKCITGIYSVI